MEVNQVFNFKDLLQQAQGLQTKIKDLQDELAGKTVTGAAGGDMVSVEFTGAQEMVSIKIEKELLDSGDPELLEGLIVGAVNDALQKVRELVSGEMSKVTGGMSIPGLM
jgi:nucleoid-associated protein EbfC